MRAPPGKLLVVVLRAGTVRVALDDQALIGIALQKCREAPDLEVRSGLQGRLVGIEQHVSQGQHHATVGLLGLQVLQLLLSARKLLLSSLRLRFGGQGLALCRLRLRLRGPRVPGPRLQEDAVAVVLRARDLLPRARLLDTSLASVSVSARKIGEMVHDLRRPVLRQRGFRLLQTGACGVEVMRRRLLSQGLRGQILNLDAGVLELLVAGRRRCACGQQPRDCCTDDCVFHGSLL